MEGFSIGRCGIQMREQTISFLKFSFSRKVFYGEGDHEPGKEPGDIVIQMEEKEHAVFQRHGEDIFGSTQGCDIHCKFSISCLVRWIYLMDISRPGPDDETGH